MPRERFDPEHLPGRACGWDILFYVAAGACVLAAALIVRIDATRRIFG